MPREVRRLLVGLNGLLENGQAEVVSSLSLSLPSLERCCVAWNLLESIDAAVSCWTTNAAADVAADSLLALEHHMACTQDCNNIPQDYLSYQ
jgi:hypothetical protein